MKYAVVLCDGMADTPVEALGGLPAHKIHCSVLAEQSIKAAIADYYKRQGIDPEPLLGAKSEKCAACSDGGCCNG